MHYIKYIYIYTMPRGFNKFIFILRPSFVRSKLKEATIFLVYKYILNNNKTNNISAIQNMGISVMFSV